MALSDLAVYSETAYKTSTEVLRQKVDLFNANAGGTLLLQSSAHQGDYSENAFFAKVTGGLVRRRDAYGSGTIAQKVMKHLQEASVKVGAGTPEMRLDPGQFKWIQQNPKVAGAAMGIQLAKDTLADMLQVALGSVSSALATQTEVIYDATANTEAADKLPTWNNLNNGQAKFGDAGSEIVAWLMHSTQMYNLYGNNLQNAERLFQYGNVNVIRDPFGKLLVMSDAAELVEIGTGEDPNVYNMLGLTPAAVLIGQNNDFDAAENTTTGDENLMRTYQAEWSYNVGIKGFTWDKENGGKSPSNAALFTSTNWDRVATSHKDLPGVIVKTL